MKHFEQKQLGEERIYFAYSSKSQFIINGSLGRNLEAGTDAEVIEECYCLIPHGFLNMILNRNQDHQPRSVCIHSGLGPPHQ